MFQTCGLFFFFFLLGLMLQERRLQILFCAGTGDTTTEEVTQATSTKSKRFPEGGEAHPAVLAGDALAQMMPWGGGKGRDEDLPPPELHWEVRPSQPTVSLFTPAKQKGVFLT